jgi:hypothetical protein
MKNSFKRQKKDKRKTVSENKETMEQAAECKRRSFYNSSNLLYRCLAFLICLITSLGFAICSAPFRVEGTD